MLHLFLVQTGPSCPIWTPKNSMPPSFHCLTVLCTSRAFPHCSKLEPEASCCVWGRRSGAKTFMIWLSFSVRHNYPLGDGNKIWSVAICFWVFLVCFLSISPLLPGNGEHWFEIIVTVQQTQVLWVKW